MDALADEALALLEPGFDAVKVRLGRSNAAEDAAAEVIRVNNAYPDLKGWAMVGGWPFFSDALMDKIDPEKLKIVAVDALPVQLTYVEKGIVEVLLGQPTRQSHFSTGNNT